MLKDCQNSKVFSNRVRFDPLRPPKMTIGCENAETRVPLGLQGVWAKCQKNFRSETPVNPRKTKIIENSCRWYWFGCLSWIYGAKTLICSALRNSLFEVCTPKLALCSNGAACRGSKPNGHDIFTGCFGGCSQYTNPSNGGRYGGQIGVNMGVHCIWIDGALIAT